MRRCSCAAGALKLPVARVFTLDQIVEAHAYMENNRAAGKLVVVTGEAPA